MSCLSVAQLAWRFYFHADQAGPVQTGTAPDYPDVSYRWAPADGQLTVWRTIDGVRTPMAVAQQEGGLYVDEQGKTVARVTDDGLLLDWKALGLSEARTNADFETESSISARSLALAEAEAENKPELCPAPSKDIGFGNTYQTRVTGLPPGLAVRLDNVLFDGCRLSNGDMIEAKGLRYQRFLLPDGEWRTTFKGAKRIERQLLNQSKAAAAYGRLVEWHVAEKRVADKIREMASPYSNVVVIWDPEGTYAY